MKLNNETNRTSNIQHSTSNAEDAGRENARAESGNEIPETSNNEHSTSNIEGRDEQSRTRTRTKGIETKGDANGSKARSETTPHLVGREKAHTAHRRTSNTEHPTLNIEGKNEKARSERPKVGIPKPHLSRMIEGGRKRPPFERMKKIFALIQDGKFPNCTTMAAGFGVTFKTVHRDLDFMRDRWELPIAYDPYKYGYYFAQPVDRFPGVPVTEKELFALCVAHKAIEQYQGTALQQPLEMAFQKCIGRLDDHERFTLQDLNDVLSFRPFAPEDAELRLFELITEAIRERRGLQFEYRKPGEKSAEVRHVHPYHLMQFNHRWYLLASNLDVAKNLESKLDLASNLDLAKNGSPMSDVGPGADLDLAVEGGATLAPGLAAGMRKFVLGRIRGAQLTDEQFERPADFDPKKFFARSLGVMTGSGDYEVVIEMDAWLTDSLRGRRWHPSQVWTELPGGGAHLQLRLSCLEEIEQWVMSWGTRATVVRPKVLQDRIARTAEALAARYGEKMAA